MTQRWHPTKNLLGLPGMPAKSARSITLHGPGRGWESRAAPNGKGLEWLETSLPEETQAALAGSQNIDALGSGASAAVTTQTRVPAKAQAVADARLEILRAWEQWHEQSGLAVVAGLHEFSKLYAEGQTIVSAETRALIARFAWNSLQGWRKALKEGGWSGLVPRHANRQVKGIIDSDAEIRDTIEAMILAKPHTNAKHVMRALRVRFPAERVPSYGTVKRWIKGWKETNARRLSVLNNPDHHRSTRKPAFGSASSEVVRLNQVWELDSTPADVLCRDGRHAVIGVIDIYSRRAKVLVVPTSKAVAIATLMRHTIMDWGVPETCRTDEGADYTSRYMRRVFADLGIHHDACPPYSPELKPFIERFFRNLSMSLFEQLPGYAGHNVAQAQDIRSRKSFAARMGESDQETFQVDMTAETLQRACDTYIEQYYHREPHQGLSGRTPFEVATAWALPVRRVENERALDLLLAEAPSGDGWRVVTKKGISVEAGLFIAAELGGLIGERVQVRFDPADFGTIWVSDADGNFICKAYDPDRVNIDRQAISAHASKRAAELDKAYRDEARKQKAKVKPHNLIDEILAQSSNVVALPGAATAYESDGLAQAAVAVASRPPAPPMSEEAVAAARARAAEISRQAEDRRRADDLSDEEEARARELFKQYQERN